MLTRIVTIGVYGFTRTDFFQTLVDAHIDTLCDIRLRRSVRGSTYAFANSQQLQAQLHELSIQYKHAKHLAPSPVVRTVQKEEDRTLKEAKRTRTVLSAAFKQAYEEVCLATFSAADFLELLGPTTHSVALLCVEREPEACHRSILAQRLARDLGVEVFHLRPR